MNDQEIAISKHNKLLSVMIIMNILFMLVILYLLIKKDEPSQTTKSEPVLARQVDETKINEPVAVATIEDTTYISETDSDEARSNHASDANKAIPKFVNAVMATDFIPDNNDSVEVVEPETTNTVTVYYDGKLVRMEETDNEGNQLITISKSLDDIGELSSDDANYIKALEELKQGTRSQITISKATPKQAATYKAKQASEEQSVDYFNKVDVSKNITQANTEKPSLVTQIAEIVSEPERTASTEGITLERLEDSYLQTLKTESIERSNEMRMVQVVKGDSLWVIAQRAYGTGYEYQKIFEANPHLTDPDKLKVGDFLRVPL